MGTQLVLIEENEPEWRLDDHTVEVGRRGIAAARKALHHDEGRRPARATADRSSRAA
jgi:hypothetical protein